MLSIAATTGTTGAGAAATGAAASSTPSPKLVHAAHEFEGQMLEQLLKPMMAGDGLGGDDDDSDAGSAGALGEFATEALGRALSEHGGFGIADSIVRELSPNGNQKGTKRVTGNLHGNTVIRAHE